MSIEISPEIEVRLTDEARAEASSLVLSTPELPVWHLGAIGALHRRDI
jgi:hypothetical protein